ncbi:MAG: hypothetical protein GXP02_05720 [Alphaproteobacteria bacterium]|nr:hypothetical protein [Alphaproteobacteria bacterium]
MTRILLISRDPGATNQLVALRHILTGAVCERRKNLFDHLGLAVCPDIMPIAKDYAGDIWQQNGITARDWPNMSSEQAIGAYLAGFAADQIITGTCHVDDRTEQAIWRVARRLGMATTAFLDSVHNIELRFRDDAGAVILPDRVALIDDSGVAAVRALGLSGRMIFISGNLYQSYIKTKKPRTPGHKWRGESLILFASDYIREMQALGLFFEITEFDCLDCLIDLLTSGDISDYLTGFTPPCRLVIRPHPKDSAGKYRHYPARSNENITIQISNSGAATEAILSAQLVAGLESSLIGEARMLGVEVLELGPIVKSRRDPPETV